MTSFLLFISLISFNLKPFDEIFIGTVDGPPRCCAVSQLNDTILFWIGTDNRLYVYDNFGNLMLKKRWKGPVQALSTKADKAILGSRKSISLVSIDGRELVRKYLADSIVDVLIEPVPLALTSKWLYRLDDKFNILWKKIIPYEPESLLVLKDLVLIYGSGRIEAFDLSGVQVWKFEEKGEVTPLQLTYGVVPFHFVPLCVFDNRIVLSYRTKEGSVIRGFSAGSGNLLFSTRLKDSYVLAIEALEDGIFATVRIEGKEVYRGKLLRLDWKGNIVKEVRTTYERTFIRDVGRVLYMYEYGNSWGIFHYDLNEVLVHGSYPFVIMPKSFSYREDGYSDLIVFPAPVEGAPYKFIHYKNRITECIKLAESLERDAERATSTERKLGYLGTAKSIMFIYRPDKVREIDRKIKVLSQQIRRKRLLKRGAFVLGDSLLIFFVLFTLTLILKETFKRRGERVVNFDTLREIESGFFHDARKKLKLLTSTILAIQQESNPLHKKSLEEYFEEDVEELTNLLKNNRVVLKGGAFKRFNVDRFEKKLKKFRQNQSLHGIQELEKELELLKTELQEYQESIQDIFRRAVENFERSFRKVLADVDFRVEKDTGVPEKKMWKDHGSYLSGILYNFLVNALQAVENVGRKEIVVSLKRGECKDDHTVVITIKDSGIGMDEDTKRTFWRKGYSGWDQKSTGLGITEETVEFLRRFGEFYVTSEPNRGTEIRICL